MLKNPYPTSPTDVRIFGRLPTQINSYFFLHVLAGTHDTKKQALISIFFDKLYHACVATGIKPVFDESNEQRVADIVARLNFNPAAGGVAAGRADLPTAIPPAQPASVRHVDGATDRIGKTSPRSRKQPANADSKNCGGRRKGDAKTPSPKSPHP